MITLKSLVKEESFYCWMAHNFSFLTVVPCQLIIALIYIHAHYFISCRMVRVRGRFNQQQNIIFSEKEKQGVNKSIGLQIIDIYHIFGERKAGCK